MKKFLQIILIAVSMVMCCSCTASSGSEKSYERGVGEERLKKKKSAIKDW